MSPVAWTILATGAVVAALLLFWFAPRRRTRQVPAPAVALSEERWIRVDRGFEPRTVVVTGGVPVKLRFSLSEGESTREIAIGPKKARVTVAPGRTVTFDFLHHEFGSVEMTIDPSSQPKGTEGAMRGAIIVAPRPARRISPGPAG